ncbi:fimbrial biogenesis chaperone [Escherichia coli]|uniref:fimbrial biogenesis chaperone n=1 Tax=Escherichia coli TaxID=562 RepID=UPI000BE5FCCF|nr:molecular chaperone [Escherichia coli]MBB8643117.1 molecular chaperone [Escherichia coli]
MKRKINTIIAFWIITYAQNAISEQNVFITNKKTYGLELGTTRLIYNEGQRSASLRVKNKQDYPVLVQSHVYTEDKKGKAPFIITPPIQKLEPDAQTRLRVIFMDREIKNKESLYWLCVKGMPPVNLHDENVHKKETTVNINILNTNCIKLIMRPASVSINPVEASKQIKWHINGQDITGTNNNPVYINFASIKANGKEIVTDNYYIAPFSSITFRLPNKKVKNNIAWTVIDDYGAESAEYKSSL